MNKPDQVTLYVKKRGKLQSLISYIIKIIKALVLVGIAAVTFSITFIVLLPICLFVVAIAIVFNKLNRR